MTPPTKHQGNTRKPAPKGKIPQFKDEFDISILPKGYSSLQLQLQELRDERFFRHGRHTLSFNRFLVMQKGGGTVVNHTGGDKHELQPGTACFIPLNTEVSCQFNPNTQGTNLLFRLPILPCMDAYGGETHCRKIHVPDCAEKLTVLRKNPDYRETFCHSQSLVWQMLAAAGSPNAVRMKRLAELSVQYGNLLTYIRTHIAADMKIETLFRLTNFKRGEFIPRFSNDFGMAPRAFVQNELLAASEHYLLHSELPIGEIAKALRFSSQSYFTIFFRRSHGMSPTHFRTTSHHAWAPTGRLPADTIDPPNTKIALETERERTAYRH